MKFRLFFPFLFSILFLNGLGIFAQESPVITRSNDRVVIEGKVYYIHVVKKGETLYSISRAYNVSQKDILLENPSAQTGLQIDQALKIPYVPSSSKPLASDSGEYIIHRVEQGQTLFSLSQFYQVKIDEIVALNPGVDEVLRVGDNIRIPRKNITPQREGFPQQDDRFHYHKVERGETLYSLSQRYNVSVRDIRRANRSLIWGLKAGEFIRIPKTPGFFDEEDDTALDYLADTIPGVKPPADTLDYYELLPDPTCRDFNYFTQGRPYNVALFIPLFLERNFPQEEPEPLPAGQRSVRPPAPQILPASIPYLEFYEGARLAIDSLKKTGLSVNLFVFDSDRNVDKIRQILNSREFREIDLIVGPFFPEEVAVVSEYALQRMIPLVTPVTTRRDFISANPYLYQVTPSVSAEIEHASLFASDFPGNNFVIVFRDEPEERQNAQRMKDYLFRHFTLKNELNQVVLKEIIHNDSLVINLEQSMSRTGENFVILVTKNQAFISDMLNRLNIFSTQFPLTVIGMYDWQRYVNLDVEYFHNVKLHYSAPFYIDYKKSEVKQFLQSFRKVYKAEPGEYGFMGFDIFYYFLSAMKSFGTDFRTCLPYLQVNLTQGDFLFRKISEYGGFENHGLSMIRYNKDFSVEKVNGPIDPRKIARQSGNR